MSDSLQTEFSEIEATEFNRRVDVAYAVIPAAIRLFAKRAELNGEEKKGVKSNNIVVYGCIALGFSGIILQWFLTDSNLVFGIGSIFSLLAVVAVYFAIDARDTKRARMLEQYVARLAELEVVWLGATAYNTFHDLSGFCNLVDGQNFDKEDKGFYEWWMKQKEQILVRVCGNEKVEKIAGTQAYESKRIFRAFGGEPSLSDEQVKQNQPVGLVIEKILVTLVRR